MRLWWIPLVGSAAALACSSFTADDTPAPSDGGTTDGPAAADGEPPADAALGDADADDVDAGCFAPKCVVLATGENEATDIVADSTDVYWTIGRAEGEIHGIARGGGTVRKVVDGSTLPRAPVVNGTVLYFATGSEVRLIDRQDAGTASLRAAGALPLGTSVTSVQRVNNALFFTAGLGVQRCTVSPNGCGGAAVLMHVATQSPTHSMILAQDKTTLWFANESEIWSATSTFDSGVKRITASKPRSLAVDETNLYFLRDDSDRVFSLSLNAGPAPSPVTLASAQEKPWAIAYDATHVFVTQFLGGRVVKIPKGGGAAVTLVAGLTRPKSIAVDADRAFVVLGDGSIVSISTN